MAVVMIGVDPHKASHTAVAISPAEEPLGQLRVRASAGQAERQLGWAQAWPERGRAVEGAGGIGHLLAQQLLAAGEQVLDVPPKLAARVRLLATGDINKNVLDAAAREPIMPAAGKAGREHGSWPTGHPLPHRITAAPLTLKRGEPSSA